MRDAILVLFLLASTTAWSSADAADTPASDPAYQQALSLQREADPLLSPGLARDLSKIEICGTKWGKDERAVTDTMKAQVYKGYGVSVPKVNGKFQFPHYVIDGGQRPLYEVDHVWSRELGGADDLRNLALQSYVGPCNAHNKDRLENALHVDYCAGRVTLDEAHRQLNHWVAAYTRRYGSCGN